MANSLSVVRNSPPELSSGSGIPAGDNWKERKIFAAALWEMVGQSRTPHTPAKVDRPMTTGGLYFRGVGLAISSPQWAWFLDLSAGEAITVLSVERAPSLELHRALRSDRGNGALAWMGVAENFQRSVMSQAMRLQNSDMGARVPMKPPLSGEMAD